jgi:protein KRI1
MSFSELTEEIEKNFFQTLACLKTKDPRIYDEKEVFFQEPGKAATRGEKGKKEKKLTLADLERKVMLEKGGHETTPLCYSTSQEIFSYLFL